MCGWPQDMGTTLRQNHPPPARFDSVVVLRLESRHLAAQEGGARVEDVRIIAHVAHLDAHYSRNGCMETTAFAFAFRRKTADTTTNYINNDQPVSRTYTLRTFLRLLRARYPRRHMLVELCLT